MWIPADFQFVSAPMQTVERSKLKLFANKPIAVGYNIVNVCNLTT